MPGEKFKLPQSSYEELVKIIKAYGHVDAPTGLDAMSKLVGLHTTIISRNVGFLIATGILEPGAKKMPTPEGKDLAQALEHEMPDMIRKWWRQIVSQNDFLSKLLTAIRIRNGMDEETLKAHIAYSAGQPKKTGYMTGARTVIDILRAAELVKEADGKIAVEEVSREFPEKQPPEEGGVPMRTEIPVPQAVSALTPAPGLQIRIQININCSADEIEELGLRLRSMLDVLAEPLSEEAEQRTQEE